MCLSVCQANILVFYFSDIIRRDIDLNYIQDTYSVELNSQLTLGQGHRDVILFVEGTVISHKNKPLKNFNFVHRHLLKNYVTNNTSIFDFDM